MLLDGGELGQVRAHLRDQSHMVRSAADADADVDNAHAFSSSRAPATPTLAKEFTMTLLRVESLTISLDGYAAGPNQSLQHPLGIGGTALHAWALGTRVFQKTLFGNDDGGETGIDNDFAARGFRNIGAWILGRNMFGPIRGPWLDESWKGWWGENPVYHVPVFVLTNHSRPPLVMEGGTTFHFVTEGIHAALERARDAAKGQDVRIGGGPNTIQQYLRERLIDEMHIAISPVLLGSGESLFAGLDLPVLGYVLTERTETASATHIVLSRRRE